MSIWFSSVAQSDSLRAFLFSDFIKQVELYHPISKTSGLLGEEIRFIRMMAKGELDPRLNANHFEKTFNGSNYFSISEANLDIPLWPGVDLKAGYDYNQGLYLNEENILPVNGLMYAGIKIPLAQGIITDKRRTAIALSKIFSEMNLNEQKLLLTGLHADAYIAYSDWVAAYKYLQIYNQALTLSRNRLDFTRAMQKNGERATIDTLEAFIQFQTRIIEVSRSTAEYVTATQNIENYLWNESGQPLTINAAVIPDTTFLANRTKLIMQDSLQKELKSVMVNNPQVVQYNLKIEALKKEAVYKRDLLKPKLYVNYNFISEPINATVFNFSPNNYKLGVNFSYPLFLRKERADIGINKLKQQENNWLFNFKTTETSNKLQAAFTELNLLVSQSNDMKNIYSFYTQLYDAEKTKFINGESSVFMVNARESKLIESEIKWYELMLKYNQKIALYNYLSGKIAY